jgi:hypothetical protein
MPKKIDWGGFLRGDPTGWLLGEDRTNPGVRYMTLRYLYELPQDDSELGKAAQAAINSGPVPAILDAQDPEGFWVKEGPGYNPKYRSTVWSLIALDQLGASPDDPRVRRGCEYYLENAISKEGAFTMSGSLSGAIYCLTGNLITAIIDLGLYSDARLHAVLQWLVRATIGQGSRQLDEPVTSPFYLKSGVSGPIFECSANNRLPCAWGGLKVMRALTRIPERDRTPLINQAIKVGTDFFFSRCRLPHGVE